MAFLDFETERVAYFEHPLDFEKLWAVFNRYRMITFNGIGYDMPLIHYALSGATVEQLKHASDRIILNDLKPWNFEKEFNVCINPITTNGTISHVDLMNVAPGKAGLKTYAGRLHSKVIRELPFPPDTMLKEEDIQLVRDYCGNDLLLTRDLYNALKVQLTLREDMTKQYHVDLRSKSDAQIAEAVMKTELEKILGHEIRAPKQKDQITFHYTAPAWMPRTETVKDVEAELFSVNFSGKVIIPKSLTGKKIVKDQAVYRMGIGGLHSSETQTTYRSDAEYLLIDRDVASYYPAIMINQQLHPKHVGLEFIKVYQSLVERRLAAKKAGQKTIAESLKICVNGLSGKMGNPYSPFYSPELMIQTTLTGQLALLMLIEMLHGHDGIDVISANTDGVTTRVRRDRRDFFTRIVEGWEMVTDFVTEESLYESLHIRDVNNYVAIKTDGTVKTKGAYTETTLQKNPTNTICRRAMLDYLTLDASIESTVRHCQDIREFVTIRKVNGGALYQGQEIGSVLRWYYSDDLAGEAFHYKINGNKVPRSECAKPLLILPEDGTLPADLDYEWYINETYTMLNDAGVFPSRR
jgi:DNA polymerase elongation subunit (family B)